MTRLATILRAIRVTESIPFCGVTLLGGLISRGPGSHLIPSALGFAISGVFFLSAFAFAFNDIQDMESDLQSESKSERPLVNGSLSVRSARVIAITVAAAGIILLVAGTPWFVVCVGLSIIPVSMLYSLRWFPLKSVPVLSSLTHLLAGSQAFVLGAWSVGSPDLVSPLIGAYFGIVFAAGHLHHEVEDLEADRSSGVKTHAIRYGSKSTLLAGFALWCLSCAYFSGLTLMQIIPYPLGWVQLAMFSCYCFGFFYLLRGRRDPGSMKRLRTLYRSVYMAGGLLMVIMLVV